MIILICLYQDILPISCILNYIYLWLVANMNLYFLLGEKVNRLNRYVMKIIAHLEYYMEIKGKL